MKGKKRTIKGNKEDIFNYFRYMTRYGSYESVPNSIKV